jgi:hypothetical protein
LVDTAYITGDITGELSAIEVFTPRMNNTKS